MPRLLLQQLVRLLCPECETIKKPLIGVSTVMRKRTDQCQSTSHDAYLTGLRYDEPIEVSRQTLLHIVRLSSLQFLNSMVFLQGICLEVIS